MKSNGRLVQAERNRLLGKTVRASKRFLKAIRLESGSSGQTTSKGSKEIGVRLAETPMPCGRAIATQPDPLGAIDAGVVGKISRDEIYGQQA